MFCQHFLALLPLIDHPAKLIQHNFQTPWTPLLVRKKNEGRKKTNSKWSQGNCTCPGSGATIKRLCWKVNYVPTNVLLSLSLLFFLDKHTTIRSILHLTDYINFKNGLGKGKGVKASKLNTQPLMALPANDLNRYMLSLSDTIYQKIRNKYCAETIVW